MAIFIDDAGATDALRRTTSLPSETACTMMAWYKLITRTDFGTFIALVDSGSGGQMIQLDDSGSNVLTIWSSGGNTTGTTINTAQWYHMAMVVELPGAGDDVLFYLDGVLDISRAVGNGSIVDMAYGNNNIDEGVTAQCAAIKVWDAILTVDEVKNEMFTYLPQRMANIHLWTPCLSTGGTTFKDFSSAGLDWTEEGTITHVVDGPPITWSKGSPKIFLPSAAAPATVHFGDRVNGAIVKSKFRSLVG